MRPNDSFDFDIEAMTETALLLIDFKTRPTNLIRLVLKQQVNHQASSVPCLLCIPWSHTPGYSQIHLTAESTKRRQKKDAAQTNSDVLYGETGSANSQPDHTVRAIFVRVDRQTTRGKHHGGSNGVHSDGIVVSQPTARTVPNSPGPTTKNTTEWHTAARARPWFSRTSPWRTGRSEKAFQNECCNTQD